MNHDNASAPVAEGEGSDAHVKSQVATLREWMESAAGRVYKPTDRRRYAVLTIDGSACTTELETAVEIIEESECEYELTDR